MDVLKEIFDEKIVEIVNVFIENPEKKFSLTDISNITKVKVATTFRIINKLLKKEFLTPVTIGKVNIYQLAKNEKTRSLLAILKKESSPLQEFAQNISDISDIVKIILESSEDNKAKLLIISNKDNSDKIKETVEKIKNKFRFEIEFVELRQEQYEGLKTFKNFDLEKNTIWEKK